MNLFKKISNKKENNKKIKDKENSLKELEKKYNVDFSGYISKDDLENEEVSGCGYEASYDMPEIISHLKITDKDNFIDIGCGKGYAMYYFSKLPFGKIHGVEYSEELGTICQDNLNKIFPLNDKFQVFIEDGCTFNKYNEYNYIYMYNPLNEQGIKKLAGTLKKSVEENPRDVFLMYQNPRFWEEFTKDGTFERIVMADQTMIMKHKK